MSEGLEILENGGISSDVIENETVQVNAGRRRGSDVPESWKAQSWLGYYTDPTQENIHVLCDAMYNGTGGFAGDIPTNDTAGNETLTNSTGKTSYLHPKAGERYYRTRVKDTPLYNFFARIVDSQITPIFSANRLVTLTKRGDEMYADANMKTFMRNATATGTSYEATQEFILNQLIVHDVAYYAVTKIKKRAEPVITCYKAIDFITGTSDEYGDLVSITFSTGTEIIKKTTYQKAVEYKMVNGFCVRTNYLARDENKSLVSLNWKEDDRVQPFETGVPEMIVRAQLPIATAYDEWLPSNPKSRRFATICLDIWQYESKVSYLATLLNLPLLNLYGDVGGVNVGAGNAMQSSEGATGYAPTPSYVSPDASLLTANIEYLKYKVGNLRDIAKENGVDSIQSNSAQSGDSKRFDFQATEQKLQNSISMLEEMDSWVFHMFDVYMNRDENVYTYIRTYPEAFYPEEQATIADLETVFVASKEAGASETSAMILSAMVKKILGKSASPNDAEVIDDEIESILNKDAE